ncbi:MAG: NUDIX hydrolase [Acidobacteriota bacterium]|nr:NUDIX hydrolase [Acidobacteriota bacterium]MDE3164124.1 NUDIX hydrolase [Acidobacteriota bacterium]
MPTHDKQDAPSITTLASREVYRNRWMRVREDEVLRSNGQKGIYGVVDKSDSAIILPVDGGNIWLVEQFRYTIQERALELPQGSWEEDEATSAEDLVRGELQEETGLHAATLIHLGTVWIAYGFLRQQQHVFLATDLNPVGNDPDAEEHDLTLHSIPIADFEQRMLDGRIRDNCTIAAWGLYRMWKDRQA